MAIKDAIITIGKWMDMYEGYDKVINPIVKSREQLLKEKIEL